LDEIFKLFNEPARTKRLKMALTASDPQAELMSKEQREARDEPLIESAPFSNPSRTIGK